MNVKQAGFKLLSRGEKNEQFEAIELTITANNPSNRIVYLLKNYWMANAMTINTHSDDNSWVKGANEAISRRAIYYKGAHYDRSSTKVVAAGSIFHDVALKPQEKISSTFVFYLPVGIYDMLEILVGLPSAGKMGYLRYDYDINLKGNMNTRAYKATGSDTNEEIKDLSSLFFDPNIQFQSAISVRQLSLWQSKDSEPGGKYSKDDEARNAEGR